MNSLVLDAGSHDDCEPKSTPGWVDRVQALKTRLLKSRKALITRAQETYLRADIAIELPQVASLHETGDDDHDDDHQPVEFCVPTERASAALVALWEDEQVRNIVFLKTVSE